MTFSTHSPGSSAQAHLPSKAPIGSIAGQSREAGDVVPEPTQQKPKPKPLAHFIAGGYVKTIIDIAREPAHHEGREAS
jgi:hypothetical protein